MSLFLRRITQILGLASLVAAGQVSAAPLPAELFPLGQSGASGAVCEAGFTTS